MKKIKEEPTRMISRSERFLAARIRASRALEEAYEVTLEPREQTSKVHEVLGSQDPV